MRCLIVATGVTMLLVLGACFDFDYETECGRRDYGHLTRVNMGYRDSAIEPSCEEVCNGEQVDGTLRVCMRLGTTDGASARDGGTSYLVHYYCEFANSPGACTIDY